MQQVLLAKDEEIVELQAKVKQAVDAEKARWASTFTALVASCKEPFRKLQSVCPLPDCAKLLGRLPMSAADFHRHYTLEYLQHAASSSPRETLIA